MLEDEFGSMEARQLSDVHGQIKPPTLISVLRRALAAGFGCDMRDNFTQMCDLLHGGRLEELSEEDIGFVISGGDLAVPRRG